MYGARPLKRYVQQAVETPLAKELVGGKIRDGQTVTVMATYDPALGDNGAFQDSECGDAVVLANLTAQPEPSPAFEVAAAAGLPLLVTATGVFHNFPGDAPSLQIDVETISPE